MCCAEGEVVNMGNVEGARVVVGPRIQETHVPEVNQLEQFEDVYRLVHKLIESNLGREAARGFVNFTYDALKVVTHRSLVRDQSGQQTKAERPLSYRTERAQLLDEWLTATRRLKDARLQINELAANKTLSDEGRDTLVDYFNIQIEQARTERSVVVAEAHARDEIALQYLNQGEIEVELPGLGKQMSRYMRLVPPESRRTPETDAEPEIFVIAGLSNDLDCVGALLAELAFRGRRVTMVGFPESYMGRITPEFAEAAMKSPTYEPHAQFYTAAVDALGAQEPVREVWSYSNGAPILWLMLQNPNFSKTVEQAVCVCPASSVDQSPASFIAGLAYEMAALAKQFRDLPKYTLSAGKKDGLTSLQAKLRLTMAGEMIKRVRTGMDLWKQARVREGGGITIVSGKDDQVTKSMRVFNKTAEAALRLDNPQLSVVEIEGSHASVLIKPDPVITSVREVQGKVM